MLKGTHLKWRGNFLSSNGHDAGEVRKAERRRRTFRAFEDIVVCIVNVGRGIVPHGGNHERTPKCRVVVPQQRAALPSVKEWASELWRGVRTVW